MSLPPYSLSDAQRARDLAYYRAVLQELTATGGAIANAIHGCATAPGCSRESLIELANAFERVTNSMCSNIVLEQSLTEPSPSHPGRVAAARKRILFEVERAIRRRTSGAKADALCAEMLEHLAIVECAGDLERSPIAALVRDMCRDLGVAGRPGNHLWKRRKPADLAALYETAAQVPPGTYRPTYTPPAAPPLTRAVPRLIHDSSAPQEDNS